VYRADHGCTGQQRLAIPRSSARASRVPTQQLIIVMIAITEEQIAQRGLTPILKKNHRFTTEPGGAREFEAWECEALGQGIIQRLVRGALDGLLPELLSDVLGREAEQRVRVAELLDELDE
jgi:hypothetical protein